MGVGGCIEDGEVFVNMLHLPWDTPSHCFDVPTGMCYLNAVSPMTTEVSFCAVGWYDCPANY